MNGSVLILPKQRLGLGELALAGSRKDSAVRVTGRYQCDAVGLGIELPKLLQA